MQKTEQKTEQQAGLGMSFCEEEGRITVFRKTLEALEWPSHYRFLYNRKMKQIAVQACGAEESGHGGTWKELSIFPPPPGFPGPAPSHLSYTL